jgi:ATP diphosphatase
MKRVLDIMDCLRDPQHGCPWDLAQDFASIVPHTLEEAAEVADCIERGDFGHLKSELGDLLFQVVFYARLAREAALFDFNDILETLEAKLLRRHPHVFPDGTLESFGQSGKMDLNEVNRQWEEIKARERGEATDSHVQPLGDIPSTLSALQRALRLQGRASRLGFDWEEIRGVFDKLDEETRELQEAISSGHSSEIAHEVGDLLFTVVNLARQLEVNPDQALRQSNRRFQARFGRMLDMLSGQGLSLSGMTADEMEVHWQAAKRACKAAS